LAGRKRAAQSDAGVAVLLALEALPDAAVTARPYVPEAELQLEGALRDLHESLVLGHSDQVWSAAFSPDGKRIVAAFANMAQVWDAATGQPIGEPLRGHNSVVWSAAYSADGKRIVTASADKTARIWDAETGQPVGEPLRGHDGGVRRAAFSPDGKRIATASQDGTSNPGANLLLPALRAGHSPQRPDCLAGHVRFELRNVGANYPFESSRGFSGSEPNSGHGDHSRLSCSAGDTQLGAGFWRDLQQAFCTDVGHLRGRREGTNWPRSLSIRR